MARSRTGCVLAVALITTVVAGAKAQDQGPGGVAFDGVARTGTDTRPVHFRFFCSSNNGPNVTGALAVEMEVPQYQQLHTFFDFDPFEGPDAQAGPLTSLRAEGSRTKASDRFTAAGSIVGSGASESFVFGVAASRREAVPLRKLVAALRPLVDGPGRLVWQQGNASAGGTPINASLDLARVQSDQLKNALSPCLGTR